MHCAHCGKAVLQTPSAINRAQRNGRPLYCDRACAGLARRLPTPKTAEQKKEEKRLYDAARRVEKHAELCAKKRKHYYANRERISKEQAEYRKANMHRHVEYCRRPEYKAWKSEYDARYRAQKDFGEFADAAMLLRDIEQEIAAQATRYDIYMTNGTINKAQTRRRAL